MTSPIVEQYDTLKKAYAADVLIMKVGSFYEAFGEDAETVGRICNLPVTQTPKLRDGKPTCGIPQAAAYDCIKKMLDNGFVVAVADPISRQEAQGKEIETVVSDRRLGE